MSVSAAALTCTVVASTWWWPDHKMMIFICSLVISAGQQHAWASVTFHTCYPTTESVTVRMKDRGFSCLSFKVAAYDFTSVFFYFGAVMLCWTNYSLSVVREQYTDDVFLFYYKRFVTLHTHTHDNEGVEMRMRSLFWWSRRWRGRMWAEDSEK